MEHQHKHQHQHQHQHEYKQGILFLADVIDYTSQANRLGSEKTDAFNGNFQEFVSRLRDTSANRELDHHDFFADLRMVAHYGMFSFELVWPPSHFSRTPKGNRTIPNTYGRPISRITSM